LEKQHLKISNVWKLFYAPDLSIEAFGEEGCRGFQWLEVRSDGLSRRKNIFDLIAEAL